VVHPPYWISLPTIKRRVWGRRFPTRVGLGTKPVRDTMHCGADARAVGTAQRERTMGAHVKASGTVYGGGGDEVTTPLMSTASCRLNVAGERARVFSSGTRLRVTFPAA
jgi:hypothetical protein